MFLLKVKKKKKRKKSISMPLYTDYLHTAGTDGKWLLWVQRVRGDFIAFCMF